MYPSGYLQGQTAITIRLACSVSSSHVSDSDGMYGIVL